MIPRTLDEWNIDVIVDLLEKGYHETEYFDFKEMLPHRNDAFGKHRLSETCCAFANSQGGFLVFGIKDDKNMAAKERLVGISPDKDFPEHFGNFPKACTPSVDWNFRNPPIPMDNGNVIHIIHVMRSWNMPHTYKRNDKLAFPKRTNKGDEEMSFDEILMSFLGYYEKRLKLNLLKNELQTIQNVSTLMVLDESRWETDYSPWTFSTAVLESVLSETYIVLAQDPKLLATIAAIRNHCRTINNRQSILFTQASIPTSNVNDRIRTHNKYLHEICPLINSWCLDAVTAIDDILQPHAL